MSEVSLTLYDVLDEYSAEIRAGRVKPGSFVWSSSLILTFCQNFFNQFFVSEYSHQITGFDESDARGVAPLRRANNHAAEARAIITLFLRFCRDYPI